ncbi:hypothetical protein EVJ58_g4878 [Rhodofomes roseus]|uniref:Uncharacterized protein n=1 Tax=Rhodofomes roseus TaxID=34475 RepID=A0A4Y9YE91_9APHY|nr:hypothetical protein EVJ58_g4878 [Rhodofomes roseus]
MAARVPPAPIPPEQAPQAGDAPARDAPGAKPFGVLDEVVMVGQPTRHFGDLALKVSVRNTVSTMEKSFSTASTGVQALVKRDFGMAYIASKFPERLIAYIDSKYGVQELQPPLQERQGEQAKIYRATKVPGRGDDYPSTEQIVDAISGMFLEEMSIRQNMPLPLSTDETMHDEVGGQIFPLLNHVIKTKEINTIDKEHLPAGNTVGLADDAIEGNQTQDKQWRDHFQDIHDQTPLPIDAIRKKYFYPHWTRCPPGLLKIQNDSKKWGCAEKVIVEKVQDLLDFKGPVAAAAPRPEDDKSLPHEYNEKSGLVEADGDEDYPDPDLLPLPSETSSPYATPPTASPALRVEPLAVPPSLKRLPSQTQMRERDTGGATPLSKPAWSVRAAESPALGLPASSAHTPTTSPLPFSSTRMHARTPSPTITMPGALFSEAEADAQEMVEVERPTRARAYRAPMPELDIAFALQLRPGLGLGAEGAWLVRFLMAMFGWLGVVVGGNGPVPEQRRAVMA